MDASGSILQVLVALPLSWRALNIYPLCLLALVILPPAVLERVQVPRSTEKLEILSILNHKMHEMARGQVSWLAVAGYRRRGKN